MTWPPRFLFHSGRPSLDFAHTGGLGKRAIWERLRRPDDLADWFAESGLALTGARVEAHDLADARELREAIWWSAQSARRGSDPPPGRLATLHRFAAEPDLVPSLGQGALGWAQPATASQGLSTLARDAIRLFGSAERGRLRACANPVCPLLFVDTSRPGQRVWCSMERCGNRAKTQRFRAKRRATPQALR